VATTLAALRQLIRARLNETLALTTPGSPLVSPQGTPGAKTITYKVVATNTVGHSEASQGTTIITGASVLSGTNFNRLTWQAVPGATGYDIYRTATDGTSPTTLGKIGSTTTAVTLDDTGLAGDAVTAPTTNTSGITTPFWTEQELLDLLILGAKDLWRAIVDLHQGHFTTNDATNVSLTASSSTLTGVPADTFRVLMLEPRDLTSNSSTRALYFKPKQYHSQSFQAARAQIATDPSAGTTIYYDILNAGSPVGAPSIVVAPQLSGATNLRLVYVHTLPTLLETDNNPIPGESDNAMVSWGVAWARAKEREDRSPDPAWFATYSTDKQSLLTALTPRQEQEEEIVEGLFDGMMEDW
jgi:hypothetical protein